MRVFVGLGSNVGDRLQNLRSGIALMTEAGIQVAAVSSVYETEAVGPPQRDFLNAVCEITTSFDPVSLVSVLAEIEKRAGRQGGERWGPRTLDLDLLLYRDEVVETEKVTVPHPELTKRAFVLVPLIEISPDATLPSGEMVAIYLESDPPGVRLYGTI